MYRVFDSKKLSRKYLPGPPVEDARSGRYLPIVMASWLTALYTSDPSLVRCEGDRVRDGLKLEHDYAGMGGWHDGMVLQRRYAAGAARAELWEVPDTDVVMLASGTLPVGTPVEENAQPFRYH
jgi:hypothetical protein